MSTARLFSFAILILLSLMPAASGFWSKDYPRANYPSNLLKTIRGGEVHVISSLLEIESIISEAPKEQLIVLDFASNNCPPCEMIAPIYHDMSDLDEFKHVRFLKVNVSDNPDVAENYGVDGWPTFSLFKNGEKVDEIVGGQAAKAGLYSLVSKFSN
jgi:thioredoxin 1